MKNIVNDGRIIASVAMVTCVQKTSVEHRSEKETIATKIVHRSSPLESPGHKGADQVAVHHPRIAKQWLQLAGEVFQGLLLLLLIHRRGK